MAEVAKRHGRSGGRMAEGWQKGMADMADMADAWRKKCPKGLRMLPSLRPCKTIASHFLEMAEV